MNYRQLMRRLGTILAPKEGWGKRKIISLVGLLWPRGKYDGLRGMNGKRAMERRRTQIERGILQISVRKP